MTNNQISRAEIERNFHSLAQSIAQAFNGTATVSEGNNFYAVIHPGTSPSFSLYLNSYAGKIEVGGVYNKDAAGQLVTPRDAGLSAHSINVSATKGVKAICMDIKRRFVQPYAEQCEALDKIRAQRNNHNDLTAATVAAIGAALGGASAQTHSLDRVYPQYSKLDCVSSFSVNGCTVRFEALTLPGEKAVRVIELLRAMQAESPT